MSLDHQNATANLTIDGLAICCFNQEQRLWQVGCMRHPVHQLRVHLNNRPVPIDVPVDARVIRIETENGETPDYDKQFPLGFFDGGPVPDRKSAWHSLPTDERENFRWAMNLDEGADVPHGTITIKPPPFPVTMAYISDALFYTANVLEPNLFLLPLGDNPNNMSPRAVDQHLYGKAADLIGADIKCAKGGGIRITIDDKQFDFLEHTDGQPWSISLWNMPDPNHHPGNPHMPAMAGNAYMQGDFQIYYDAMDVTGDKYSLWGPVSMASVGRTDCNTVWVGDGLDGMTTG
jgi:hypothetical protein